MSICFTLRIFNVLYQLSCTFDEKTVLYNRYYLSCEHVWLRIYSYFHFSYFRLLNVLPVFSWNIVNETVYLNKLFLKCPSILQTCSLPLHIRWLCQFQMVTSLLVDCQNHEVIESWLMPCATKKCLDSALFNTQPKWNDAFRCGKRADR